MTPLWAVLFTLAAADPPGTVKVMTSAPPLVDQATGESYVLINPEEVISVFAVGPAKLQCAFRINVLKKAKTAPTVTLEVTTAAKEPVKLRIIPRLNKTAWKRPADLRPSESAEFYVQIPDGPQLFEFKFDGGAKQGGALRIVDSFTSRRALAVDAPTLTLQGMPVSMPGSESTVEASPAEPAPVAAATPTPVSKNEAPPPVVAAPVASPPPPKPVKVTTTAPAAEPAPTSASSDEGPRLLHVRALAGAGVLAESSGGLGSSGAFEAQAGVRASFTPAWSAYGGWEMRVGDVAVPFTGQSGASRTTELRHALLLDAGFAPTLLSLGGGSLGLAFTAGYRLHAAGSQLASALTGYIGGQAGLFYRTSALTLRALGGGAAAIHDSTAPNVALGKNVARFSATLEAEIAIAGPLALITSYRGEFLLRQFALRQAHSVLLGVALEFL